MSAIISLTFFPDEIKSLSLDSLYLVCLAMNSSFESFICCVTKSKSSQDESSFVKEIHENPGRRRWNFNILQGCTEIMPVEIVTWRNGV